jgi:hypothetical protein
MTPLKFFLSIHSVPFSVWWNGFVRSMLALTCFVIVLADGEVAAIQANPFPAQCFLMLGTLFTAWLWLDEQQQEGDDE